MLLVLPLFPSCAAALCGVYARFSVLVAANACACVAACGGCGAGGGAAVVDAAELVSARTPLLLLLVVLLLSQPQQQLLFLLLLVLPWTSCSPHRFRMMTLPAFAGVRLVW